MLGRPYHFVKPRKGQFTVSDNSVEEMKDASSSWGAPLRSMQISGGMKGGLVPALLEFANGHFLRGIWKMITCGCWNPHSVIKYRTYTAASQQKKDSY